MFFGNIYLFVWWSVRAYNIILRDGLDIRSAKDAIEAGDLCRDGKLQHGSKIAAIEFYRAGGLGIFPIYNRLSHAVSLQKIREDCIKFDKIFKAKN